MDDPELSFEILPQVLADLDPESRKLLLDEVANNLGTLALLVTIQLVDRAELNNPELQEHAAKRCEELAETARQVLQDLVEHVLFVRKAN